MLFSVIVPIYKVETFLKQCIESVLNQSIADFELILVDDGSPDQSGNICDGYAAIDKRITVIHKENGGLVSARKAGAEIAKGEYVVCLDGDDWLSVDSLEIIKAIVEKYNADIVIGSSFWSYAKNDELHKVSAKDGFYNKERIKNTIYPSLIEDRYCNYFSPNLWAKAIKRDLYLQKQLSVDSRIQLGEDQAVVKPCIYGAETLYITDKPLYFYRQNNASMTKNKSVVDLNNAELIARQFESQINMAELDFQAQVYRRFVHDLFNSAVSQFNDKSSSYKDIKHRIISYLNQPTVRERIYKCEFSIKSIKGLLALFALKTKSILLLKIYNAIKNKYNV